MKAKIKVKYLADVPKLEIIKQGDWIDLRCARDTKIVKDTVTYIPLGVAIQLPQGYEAVVCSRSSTPKKQHIWNPSALGVIDNSYCGDNDQWMWPATTIGMSTYNIAKDSRICQFRIQLSQRATTWQRIKWLFTSGVKIVEVKKLNNKDRNGLGSTDIC